MLLTRFYDTRLAQASYLVGCQATGDAIVIDPARAIEQYVAAAKAEKFRLAYVTETHIHADFLSGTRELAKATGAQPVLSDEGGPDWTYAWAKEANALLVKDGATLMVGNIKVEILHTPGHTPEHICFRITDTKATERPMGVFTGDFIFVGDVGRPDLLERAAGVEGTMIAGAKTLYASIQRFKEQPDYLQIWPGHGAGSACGKALGAVPSSTLGYERFANWGLTAAGEAEFVQMVLEGQPEPPAYFKHMKRLNRGGPPLRPTQKPQQLQMSVAELVKSGRLVVDTRRTAEFAKGHVRGTINVPNANSFATYAGTVLPWDRTLVFVVPPDGLGGLLEAAYSIGLDRIEGFVTPDALGSELDTTAQATPKDAAAQAASGAVTVLDVRKRSEYREGHIPHALHIPLGEVAERAGEIPADRPVILQCEGGTRSAIAASVLRALGRHDVANLQGGFTAWEKAGLPVESELAESPVKG